MFDQNIAVQKNYFIHFFVRTFEHFYVKKIKKTVLAKRGSNLLHIYTSKIDFLLANGGSNPLHS